MTARIESRVEPALRSIPRPPTRLRLRDVPRSDPLLTLRAGSRLISTKVGLIKHVGCGTRVAQDPRVHSLGVTLSDLSRYSDITHSSKSGGAGTTMLSALAASIGEAVERYCMYVYDREQMALATYDELGDDAVHPDELRLHTREQLATSPVLEPLDYFTESSRIRWVWGHSLTEDRPRLVPAALVYLAYRVASREDGEVAIGRNASNGLAAGYTLEEAILSGLLELIERDSFINSWQHRVMGPRIRVDDPHIEELLRHTLRADHPKVDVRIFDNTLDTPAASTLLILRRPTEIGPVLCVGSAARLDPRAAVIKCLEEAGQAMPYFRHLAVRDPDWKPAEDCSNVEDFDAHARLYLSRPEWIPEAFDFCERVGDEVALSEMPDRSTGRVLGDLEALVEGLRAVGSEVVAVDITSPDVRQVGLRVVRVLATNLVPLHGHHLGQFLAPRRLQEVPRKLGWERRGWDPRAGLNPFPHPFP